VICPHCGNKIHDPGLDRFCPSCGKEIPHETKDEKAILRDRKVSIGLLFICILMITLGLSFILPDVIITWIDPEMDPMYWPYSGIVVAIGVVLLFVRHPFAKRSRNAAAILIEQAQAKYTCSYCGAINVPGSLECRSCGAPFKE
jgi:predicted RNA-binding Zn-ribbon protein involved in translation (DUF1610 family)